MLEQMAGKDAELWRRLGSFPMMVSDDTVSWDRSRVPHRSLCSNHTFDGAKTLSSVEGSRRKKRPNENIDLWFLV